jgi:hypothetical protein
VNDRRARRCTSCRTSIPPCASVPPPLRWLTRRDRGGPTPSALAADRSDVTGVVPERLVGPLSPPRTSRTMRRGPAASRPAGVILGVSSLRATRRINTHLEEGERGKFPWPVSSANWRRSSLQTLSATPASWGAMRAARCPASGQTGGRYPMGSVCHIENCKVHVMREVCRIG